MIRSFLDLVRGELETLMQGETGAPSFFSDRNSENLDPGNFPLLALYQEGLTAPGLVIPEIEKERKKHKSFLFSVKVVMDLLYAPGGECEKWASLALNMFIHSAEGWIKEFNASPSCREQSGLFTTITTMEKIILKEGKNLSTEKKDHYCWIFQLSGTFEFIREFPEGIEPIEEITIDTRLRNPGV